MIDFRLLRHLWLFLHVAEKEHFGRAAEALNMSQPPLTEQIKTLEQHLGIKLFDRSRQGTKLTAEGKAILPLVQTFAAQMQQLEAGIREIAAGQTGVLTVGAITQALSDVLPELLQRIRQTYPQLTLMLREIDSSDAEPLLKSGEVDLVFARLDGNAHRDLDILPLASSRLAVALSDRHPLASCRHLKLADLADENFVMFARAVSPISFDAITSACIQSGFSPRILYEVRTAVAQLAFSSCGQGVALVPLSLDKLAPPNVCVKMLDDDIRLTTTAAAWLADNDNPTLHRILPILKDYPIQSNPSSKPATPVSA